MAPVNPGSVLVQFQADISGPQIGFFLFLTFFLFSVLPTITETTALGAAIAAAIGVGAMKISDVKAKGTAGRTAEPAISAEQRARQLAIWRKAIEKSLNWAE